jgi:hypothetical protein
VGGVDDSIDGKQRAFSFAFPLHIHEQRIHLEKIIYHEPLYNSIKLISSFQHNPKYHLPNPQKKKKKKI